MRVREYRHKLEIQNLAGSTSAGTRGQSQKAFATAETVYGKVEQVSGQERAIGRQLDAVATHRIEMHYTANLLPPSQILFGTRTFAVASVDNVEERNRTLIVDCREVIST